MKTLFYIFISFWPYLVFAQPQRVPSPIGAQSIGDLIVDVTRFVARIAVVLAAIAIIVVGFKFVSASMAGKPDEVAKARKTLLWVLIGTAIVVGASVITGAIIDSLKKL